jgi:predicted dehydrogenase
MLSRRTFVMATAASTLLSSRPASAAETLRIGCIGTGGRCRRLMEAVNLVPNTKIVALCDVWEAALAQAQKLADPQAFTTKDYRALLDRKDVDAVIIGSPDHWHVPLAVAACQAKKDVYVEKPLTHDLSEGQQIIDAQNEHQRIVQVGTQQRSMPHIAEARELVQSGKIGRVVKVTMSWNRNTDRVKRFPLGVDPKQVDWKAFLGNAKTQPFDEYRMRNWRWFWDFGGGIFTDLMVHWIDVAHWVLNVDHPLKAVSLGEAINSQGVWETPDTVQTILSYPNQLQMHFEGTFSNARKGAHIEFMGTDGTIYCDRGRMELVPEKKSKYEAKSTVLGTGPKGADFYDKPDGELLHITNWIDCIRSRKKPTAPAEAGVSGAGAAHLANLALRGTGAALWPRK